MNENQIEALLHDAFEAMHVHSAKQAKKVAFPGFKAPFSQRRDWITSKVAAGDPTKPLQTDGTVNTLFGAPMMFVPDNLIDTSFTELYTLAP